MSLKKNTVRIESITHQEALEWLAALEDECHKCLGETIYYTTPCDLCHGIGKMAVLDLREPCPCLAFIETDEDDWTQWPHCAFKGPCFRKAKHGTDCENCHGPGWRPKQGPTAVQDAMVKAGWEARMVRRGDWKRIRFWQQGPPWASGDDADDAIAAMKAMKAAGYGRSP